jgi:ParB-like nuclease domain
MSAFALSRPEVEQVPLLSLRPCPENDGIYSAPSLDDPDILDLITSIRDNGILTPIHISVDNYIISGHRRRFCAIQAGLREVPVIRRAISYWKDQDAFRRLLIDANEQRKKSTGMLLREAAMRIDPKEAVQAMRTERKERDEGLLDRSDDTIMESGSGAKRKKISEGSMPFLAAALRVANENRDFWPLSVRQIHYRLLNDPPLKFTPKGGASKIDRRYGNDPSSYRALVNLLARARIEGLFPWEAIDDETRPEDLHAHYWNPQAFFKDQFANLLKGYRRNRMQSQPDHVEIVVEKLTVRSILNPIAGEHSIPITVSRGHCGPTLKRKIVRRFLRSKKAKLILLCVTDLDPAGEAIVQNFADDFADDFGLDASRVMVLRAGLNMDRVEELDLEPSYDTEEKDISTKRAYEEKYGTTDAYELEAMEPAALQAALTEDIDSVLDKDAYNAELDQEDKDAVAIQARRAVVADFLRTLPD